MPDKHKTLFNHLNFLLDSISTKSVKDKYSVEEYFERVYNPREYDLQQLIGVGPLEITRVEGPSELRGNTKEIVVNSLMKRTPCVVNGDTPCLIVACQSLKELKQINVDFLSFSVGMGTFLDNFGDSYADIFLFTKTVFDVVPFDLLGRGAPSLRSPNTY